MRPKYIRTFAALATATLTVGSLIGTTPQVAAQEEAAATKLTVGSEVPALEGITWLQGEPVKSLNEKGKVYMLELWATWCGPCVAIIPHVNDLHKKYADKGLVIIGMNVWEDKVEAPTEFLKKQGDGMSYRVAFSGGGQSAFATNWLKPAGVQGIPHAILVKDGKILYSGHPGQLKDASIEAMLAGTYDAAAEAKAQAEAEKAQRELREKVMPLFQAEDWDGILEYAATLEDSNPAKLQLKLTAVMQKADWKELTKLRAELAAAKESPITTESLDQNAALGMKAGEGAKEYALEALKTFKVAGSDASAPEQVQTTMALARLNFLAGNAEATATALASAKSLLEKVEHPQAKQQLGTIIPAAEKAVAEGSFPSFRELMQAGK